MPAITSFSKLSINEENNIINNTDNNNNTCNEEKLKDVNCNLTDSSSLFDNDENRIGHNFNVNDENTSTNSDDDYSSCNGDEKDDEIGTEHNSDMSDNELDSSASVSSTLTPSIMESTLEPMNEQYLLNYSDNGEDLDSSEEYEKKDDTPIIVTGGAGFIGSHVANVLLKRGEQVAIVDELNDYYDVNLKRENLNLLRKSFGEDRLRIYEGDICDQKFIENVFSTEKPRRIIHLAARAGVRPSIEDPFIYIHSNIKATTILLELARLYSCTSFAFASSSSVYGDSDKSEFSETDTVDFPSSPYAATKKSCELLAYTYYHLYGLNCAGLRFFTVYGPRGRPDMAPFKFMDRISRGLPIQQFGDGSSSRDYTFIDDIVDGVVRSLDRPLGYQIYNLGNGNPIELRTFIKTVESNVGKSAVIELLPDQPGDVPRTCANISKARKLLGYNPRTEFEEGIRITAEWYKEYYSRK